jgi:hypothetical protein
MKPYTKSFAKEMLEIWKNDSAVFNGLYSIGAIESRLIYSGFSKADAIAITMALVIAGAKFRD